MQYIEGKSRKQCVLFPQNLDEIIDENNDVRFIGLFAESIDAGSLTRIKGHILFKLLSALKIL